MTYLRTLLAPPWRLIKRWPVRAQAVVVGAITLGTAFGLGWDGGQVGAVTGFSAVVLAFITEQATTPTSAPSLVVGTPVTVKGAADQPPPDAVVALRSELRGAQPE